MKSSKKITLGQIEDIAVEDVQGLLSALSGKLNSAGIIGDTDTTLTDGVYRTDSNTTNFPFASGILIVKNDAQTVHVAVGYEPWSGSGYRTKLGVRRQTGGTWQPWEIAWTNIDFSPSDFATAAQGAKADTALQSVEWGDIVGSILDQNDLKAALESKGVQLTADQPNAMVYLKDANGNTISSLNVGFLNNEGTTISFNTSTNEIELKDDQGNVLSSFPASALVTNMPDNLNLSGASLQLRDVSNNVLSSVTLKIANIQGLQTELNSKEPAFTKNSAFNKDFGQSPGTVMEGNKWGNFISYVNNVAVLIAGSVMTGQLGILISGSPTEDIDVNGTGRFRNVTDGGDYFAKLDGTGVLKRRTLQQTKDDLGLTTELGGVTENQIGFDSGQKLFTTFQGSDLTVILPSVEEAAAAGGEYEITVYNGTTLNFKEYNAAEELVNVTIEDIATGESVTSHQGPMRLICESGTWYKLGK